MLSFLGNIPLYDQSNEIQKMPARNVCDLEDITARLSKQNFYHLSGKLFNIIVNNYNHEEKRRSVCLLYE